MPGHDHCKKTFHGIMHHPNTPVRLGHAFVLCPIACRLSSVHSSSTEMFSNVRFTGLKYGRAKGNEGMKEIRIELYTLVIRVYYFNGQRLYHLYGQIHCLTNQKQWITKLNEHYGFCFKKNVSFSSTKKYIN